MAESVGLRVSGEVVAVGVGETFRDDDLAEFFALQHAFDVLDNLGLVEGNLGKEDEVRRIVRVIAAFREARLRRPIQPALRPMTSTMETRSPWPIASLSHAISRTVVARYLITLP